MRDNAKKQLFELFPQLVLDNDLAMSQLVDSMQSVCIKAHQHIFHVGDPCGRFLLVLKGSIRVQLTSSGGREVTLYRIGSGGSCILTTSCLLGRASYPAEAIAESDVVAVTIPHASFKNALEGSGRFRQFVFDSFASRLTSVIERMETIKFATIDARLAMALLDFDRKRIDRITHQDLALELGTAREIVSRHIKRFETSGWVRLGRGRVTDRVSLGTIAQQPESD